MKAASWVAVLSTFLLAACGGMLGGDSGPVLVNKSNVSKLEGQQWELKTITLDGTRIIMHPDGVMTIAFAPQGEVAGLEISGVWVTIAGAVVAVAVAFGEALRVAVGVAVPVGWRVAVTERVCVAVGVAPGGMTITACSSACCASESVTFTVTWYSPMGARI